MTAGDVSVDGVDGSAELRDVAEWPARASRRRRLARESELIDGVLAVMRTVSRSVDAGGLTKKGQRKGRRTDR